MIVILLVITLYHLHVHTTAFSKVKCFRRLTIPLPLQAFIKTSNREHNSEEYTELVDVVDRPINIYPQLKPKPTQSVVEITDQMQPPASQHDSQNATVEDPHLEVEAPHVQVEVHDQRRPALNSSEQREALNSQGLGNLVHRDESAPQSTSKQSGISSYHTANETLVQRSST